MSFISINISLQIVPVNIYKYHLLFFQAITRYAPFSPSQTASFHIQYSKNFDKDLQSCIFQLALYCLLCFYLLFLAFAGNVQP